MPSVAAINAVPGAPSEEDLKAVMEMVLSRKHCVLEGCFDIHQANLACLVSEEYFYCVMVLVGYAIEEFKLHAARIFEVDCSSKDDVCAHHSKYEFGIEYFLDLEEYQRKLSLAERILEHVGNYETVKMIVFEVE